MHSQATDSEVECLDVTDADVDWLDDDELFSSQHLDSLDPDVVSSPKKPKIY